MLSLSMKSGEYLTINGNIVVQVFRDSGPQFRVAVKAPREVPIVRGEVLERTEARPDGLLDQGPKKTPSDRVRSARRLDQFMERKERQSAAIREMRALLDRMDTAEGSDLRTGLQKLRTQLDLVAETTGKD